MVPLKHFYRGGSVQLSLSGASFILIVRDRESPPGSRMIRSDLFLQDISVVRHHSRVSGHLKYLPAM
ncbi:hypothetical protein MPTK1_1g26620 [Marchantia polymorpha subsp. ruderalis]|uniref:Uncharacterized protein n=2 Tax=Marchantia polymorpha TaxID=3197 RepID=A0AAF6AUK5_MARPO|nr:hypothetical protein MARPO_0002s0216 [Marchantia polymorpha]BBN00126.1 hypothetical protein Mp_1g26620 [Marchantia polymorpha subsp. ruderalis]|eukprot:PTQ49758.1 hypothetical protein MARPO_0002s0216 [Marchantia polymorpha]